MAKEFIPVNELLERTTLEQFINHYNFDTEVRRKGNEERIRNPFACEKCSGNNQAVSVNWQAAVFTSHCYHCNVRGRVTTLLFGMKYGRQPSGGKLKGSEFKDIAADIAQVAGHQRPDSQTKPIPAALNQPVKNSEPEAIQGKPADRRINLPLHRNPDERIARLVRLSDELIRDPAAMSARAQTYLASRPYMTQEIMETWDVGYLPSNSKSMLRGKFVYALRNERSEKIGYVGRDLAFKDKLAKWENGDRTTQRPIKAKFPPGFAKGDFLYGAEAKRMEADSSKIQLKDIGLLVCEGMNDCLALGHHGILAVSLCGNRIAEGQLEKLIRWSKSLAGGKVTLMLDNDKEGWEGTMEVMQKLASHVHVATIWSPDSHGGKYIGQQPEQLDFPQFLELFHSHSCSGEILKQIENVNV
ncbi:MAG: toprim domain-containing protein [Planctomycetota bacterium]